MSESYIASELRPIFREPGLFTQLAQLRGEVFREVPGRVTTRVRLGEGAYFAKLHFGIGWLEIFKDLLQGRLPVLGARNEWRALSALAAAGVPSLKSVLFVEEGANPARRRSAIITEALEQTESLKYYEPASPVIKRRLIAKLAAIAGAMHRAGVNHRDFYLCHFLMQSGSEDDPKLYIIDLHRAQIRRRVPDRWLEKDLGGLLFSALEKGVTKRDLYRFIRIYTGLPLRQALRDRAALWRGVCRRARRLYLQNHDTIPPGVARLLRHP